MKFFSRKKKEKEAASEGKNPEDMGPPPPAYNQAGEMYSGYGQQTYGQNTYQGVRSSGPPDYTSTSGGESRQTPSQHTGPSYAEQMGDDPRAAILAEAEMERDDTKKTYGNTNAMISEAIAMNNGILKTLQEDRAKEEQMMHDLVKIDGDGQRAGHTLSAIAKGNRALGWALPSGEKKFARKIGAAGEQQASAHSALEDQLRAQREAEDEQYRKFQEAAGRVDAPVDTSNVKVNSKYMFDFGDDEEQAAKQEADEREIRGQQMQLMNGLDAIQLGLKATQTMVEGSNGRLDHAIEGTEKNTRVIQRHNWTMEQHNK